MRTNILLSALAFMAAISCRYDHDEVVPPGDLYYPQVRTIVQQRCTNSCHAPSFGFPQGMPVILETDADIVQNATNIKEAVADPVSPFNHRMPPEGEPLSAEQIQTIVQWWSAGGTTAVCPLN